MTKTGVLALAVGVRDDSPILIETLSEQEEIDLLQNEIKRGAANPLGTVRLARESKIREDEAFGDYVEQLLSQPFLKPEIQEHGLQWLRSRIKIEQFKRYEGEAATMIADFAFRIYLADRERTDFVLCGPSAKVRVLVIHVPEGADCRAAA